MGWLQLSPHQVLLRIEADVRLPVVPTLMASVLRAILGFTVVSILGFAPWAIAGAYIHEQVGESGLYALCALVFIMAAGPLMHRLIIGPGSLLRFSKLFALSFGLYAVAWTICWMLWKGHVGSVAGLLVGTALMGWVLVLAFDARGKGLSVIITLFLLNSVGYFVGGVLDGWIAGLEGLPVSGTAQTMLARSSWALAYGIGFGAGLGVAFYQCQAGIRELLAQNTRGDADLEAGLPRNNA